MTTSPPALSVPTTEVCRITVEGPSGRADLALPVSTALAALLPVLLRHVVPGPERNGAPWVLQRLGEDPLDLDGTPDTLGLRHGDVLYLRPADEPLAGLHFDDISDGVAHVIDKQTDRWRPELTRRLAIVLTALAFVALGVTVYGSGPGTLATVACGVIALVLGAGCVVASRMGASASSVRTAGVGALLFAGLAGLAPFHGAHEHFTLGQHGLLLAAGTVALVSGVLLLLNVLPFAVPGTFLLTAVVTAVTAAVMSLGQSAQHAVALVGVGMFVLGLFGPRLTLRAARLRVPQLPRNAEELQQGIEPEEEETVIRRVRIANSYLNTLSISSALVYTVTFLMLVRDKGWIGWLLPLVFGAGVLLRARNLTGVFQRTPMAVVGAFGLGVVVIAWLAPAGVTGRVVALGVLLVAAGLLLVAAWRLPTGRLLPVWGYLGDIMETLTAIALLPLLLQSLHVYAYFRTLAS